MIYKTLKLTCINSNYPVDNEVLDGVQPVDERF
jgi:hypothetical protein